MSRLDLNEAPDGYVAVESEACTGCAFRTTDMCEDIRCASSERNDGCAVIFVKKPDAETPLGYDPHKKYVVASSPNGTGVTFIPVEESDPNGIPQNAPGAKLDAGKMLAGVLGDFSLALKAVAEVGTFGANKYTRGGWQQVPNGRERYTDAMWRHLLAGGGADDQSKLLHEAHMAWNVLAALELRLREEKKGGA